MESYTSFERAEKILSRKKYFTLRQPIISHEKISKHLYLLGLNFILGLNVISPCFNFIIIHINCHTLKQKKVKFNSRIKLNHNIFIKIIQSFWLKRDFCKVMFGSRKSLKERSSFDVWAEQSTYVPLKVGHRICYQFFSRHHRRVVKSSRLPAIAPDLVSIGRLLCLAFLYGWRF